MARIIKIRRNNQQGINDTNKRYYNFDVIPFYISDFIIPYSSTGASTGQTPAQVPQDIHADWSITNLSSPCDIH